MIFWEKFEWGCGIFLENKAIDKHQFREEDASSNLYELLMRNILKKLSFLSLIPVQFFFILLPPV